jgi:enamine deaminase RidA (YjgF/YER057c/UK114 family)
MPHRIVNPPELGPPRGFSHAVVAGDTVYLAGQIGTGRTILDQFDSALANLLAALGACDGKPSDLVSLQVFVTDVAAYQAVLPELGRACSASMLCSTQRRWSR